MASTIFKVSTTADSVLHKVEEFINIGKEEQALDIIYSFVVSNKAKQWSREFERLMFHLIDLSPKFEKQEFIREGLVFFRDISQAHNTDSFEQVCNYYGSKLKNNLSDCIKMCGNKEELYYEMNNKYDAQAFFFNSLDVQEGKVKERFKKSWRNLCHGFYDMIDLTFFNIKLFSIYIDTTRQFMELIEKHEQMQDFREFIEHITTKQQKLQKTQVGLNTLKNPEINYKLLQERKHQLNVSYRLQMIQESFSLLKSINFLIFCKKSLNRELSFYYENLAIIFEKGGFRYFQVLALQNNFFNLVKAKSEKSLIKKVAEQIILATLSINSKSEEFFLSEDLLEKYQFLFPSITLEVQLENLYKNIDQMNLVEFCDENVKDLYYTCTGRYSIYDFSDHIVQGLKNLPQEVSSYRPLIQQNSIQIILKLLSNYFTNISFEELKEFTKFTEFFKVKQFILKSIIDKTINVRLNYKEQMVEFPNNQIDVQKIRDFQNKIYNMKRDIVLSLLNYQSQMQKTQEDKKQEFLAYLEYTQNEKSQQEEKALKEERDFLQSKVKVVKKSEFSEEELRKKQKLQEIEEKNKFIERKLLGEKKKVVEDLLKLKPDIKMLNKPLAQYTDEEIVQINIDFFDSIADQIKKEKEEKTRNKIEKGFNVYDYYKRFELQQYFDNLVKHRKEEQVNLEDLAEQRVELEKIQEEKRQEMEIAQAFIEDFQIELQELAENELEKEEEQFVELLQQEFGEEVLKAAREKYEKHLKEKQEQQLKNPQQKRRGFQNVKTQGNTGYGNQQSNFSRQLNQQQSEPKTTPITALSRRGVNLPKTEQPKLAPRNQGMRTENLSRGQGEQPKRIISNNTQTKMASRGEGFKKPKEEQQKKPTQKITRQGLTRQVVAPKLERKK